MKSYYKLIIKIMACFLTLTLLTGCWSAHELNKLAIVMGIGIDKSRNGEKIHVTAQVAKVSGFSTNSSTPGMVVNNAFANLSQDGKTISEALENFSRMLDRKLLYSHNQVIVLGEDLAGQGIKDYIDFFLRNRDTRLLVWLLVSEQKPKEIMDVPPVLESISGIKLGELIRNQQQISIIPSVDLREFVSNLMSKSTAPVVPIIRILNQDGNTIVYIEDTAVFLKDKMVGRLNRSETRGLLWGTNKVKNGDIVVAMENGKNISINVTRAKSKIIPQVNGKQVTMTIKIEEEGDLEEQTTSEDLVNPKAFKELEKLEDEAIKKEVMATVEKGKKLNADVFGFGDMIYKHYPKDWKRMEKNWNYVFQNINVKIKVNARLRRNGRITKPIMNKSK